MYLFLFGTFIIGYIIYKYIEAYLSPLNKIPEPKRHPLLRHFQYFVKAKDTLDLISSWCYEFKEYGLFKIDMLVGPNGPFVVLLKSEYIKTVLSKPEQFKRSDFLRKYIPLSGNGLLTATADDHRNLRKFFAKSFSMSQMKYFVPVFNKHALKLVEIWKSIVQNEKNGSNITVRDYITHMSLDNIGEISFGHHFNSQDTKDNPIAEAFKTLCNGVIDLKARLILTYFPFMWYMPFGPAQRLTDYTKMFNDVIDEVIATREKKIAENSLTETEENDMLNVMILERNNGNFTDQLIRDSAFTFLFAGQETVAIAIPGVLYYLAKHPDLQEKVRKEINQQVVETDSLTLEELDQLTYTDAFIKESLRLFQPAPQNARVTTVDYKFGDFVVPKDTAILIPHLFIHEGEDDFEKAKEFIPERFLKNGLKHSTPFTFGYGLFSCIGKHFALLEIKATIVHLLKNFKFSVDPEHAKFDRKIKMTISIEPSFTFRVTKL